MIRTWKLLAFVTAAVLGVQSNVLFAQVSGPAEAGVKTEKTLAEKIDDGFKNMFTDMAIVKKNIEQLKGEVQGKNLALNIGMEKNKERMDALEAQMKSLSMQLVQITQDLAKLQPTTSTIARSAPAASGRLVLVNLYTEDVVFVINQNYYTVRPRTNLPVDFVPAGGVTFEVISPSWGRRGSNSATLTPGETLTLTAR